VNRRRTGQIAAGLAALISFAWAVWASHTSAMPEFRIYDGYWMILGATVAILIAAPLVWRWPRERSLVAIAAVAAVGCVVPLIVSALRQGVPVAVRLRGAWWLGGADLVGAPLVIGFVALWFAIRKYEDKGAPNKGR
jgi:cellobiose-specific phosphotransferase system component IIC